MFKVGDNVRVKANLVGGKDYNGCRFAEHMSKYVGKKYLVSESWMGLCGNRYCLEGADGWTFSDDMLEPATEDCMYKIGTKLKIIEAGEGAMGCEGCEGVVTNQAHENGMFVTDEGFNVSITKACSKYPPINSIWRVSKNGTYQIIGVDEMTKNDLQVGMTVRTENGKLAKVLENVQTKGYGMQKLFFSIKDGGSMTGDSYSDNLKFLGGGIKGYNIVEIFKAPHVNHMLDFDTSVSLWKRQEPEKMTVAEIEKLLGRKIEIVSE